MNRQAGFTLVELIIALAVFAVVSAASFIGLNSALRTYSYFTDKSHEQSRVEIFIALISRDFIQAIPRVVRDGNGDYQPAFHLDGGKLIEFSRSGLPKIGRSSGVSRVSYAIKKNTVWRYSWPYLDNTRTTEPVGSKLLENVKSISIKAIDESLNTHSRWPLSRGYSEIQFAQLPQALEVTVEIEDEGTFSRFIPGVSSVYIKKKNDDATN